MLQCSNYLKAFYENLCLWCKRAFVSVIAFLRLSNKNLLQSKPKFHLARRHLFVVNLFVVLKTLPLKVQDMKETKLYKNTYWMRRFKCISSSAHYCYFYVYRIIYSQFNKKSGKRNPRRQKDHYPKMLISGIVEGWSKQKYFRDVRGLLS